MDKKKSENKNQEKQKEQPLKPKRNDYPSGYISSLRFKGLIQIRNK